VSDGWIKLIKADVCPVGELRYVESADRELAVAHLGDPDRFIVFDNSCPHAGGNLAAGELEANVVVCPWHFWGFDLDRGRCIDSDTVHLGRYETRVIDGWVAARLDSPLGPCP